MTRKVQVVLATGKSEKYHSIVPQRSFDLNDEALGFYSKTKGLKG